MTEATQQALCGLRDLSTIKWYVIPLLAIVFYIYTKEIKDARRTGNWNAILAGLTVFGADFFNETWNGWVMYLTQRSAFWTTPGDTALRTLVGWNIEIMFMFLILGIIYYHTLSESTRRKYWASLKNGSGRSVSAPFACLSNASSISADTLSGNTRSGFYPLKVSGSSSLSAISNFSALPSWSSV